MRLTVRQEGTPPLVFAKQIEFKFIEIKEGMRVLGDGTRDHMKEIISSEKHRKRESKGNLEKSINSYVSSDGWTVGVGDIQELNYCAPYWYLINYGGMSTVAARGQTLWGHFEGNPPQGWFSGTGVGTQSFYRNSRTAEGEIFPMRPKNPVWAMNYIEKTVNWLATVWKVHFYNWTKTTKIHTFTR